MVKRLSDKQQRIKTYIVRFLSDNGYPPSIREIQSACKISSTSVVDYNLNILESRGLLKRHADVSRGIKLVKGEQTAELLISVPVIGTIAAGTPIPVPTPDTWDKGGLYRVTIHKAFAWTKFPDNTTRWIFEKA